MIARARTYTKHYSQTELKTDLEPYFEKEQHIT